jgi:hypothetical protein
MTPIAWFRTSARNASPAPIKAAVRVDPLELARWSMVVGMGPAARACSVALALGEA